MAQCGVGNLELKWQHTYLGKIAENFVEEKKNIWDGLWMTVCRGLLINA